MENQDPKRLNEKTLSFEEHKKLHDEYWNSLTEKQRLKLAKEATERLVFNKNNK